MIHFDSQLPTHSHTLSLFYLISTKNNIIFTIDNIKEESLVLGMVLQIIYIRTFVVTLITVGRNKTVNHFEKTHLRKLLECK